MESSIVSFANEVIRTKRKKLQGEMRQAKARPPVRQYKLEMDDDERKVNAWNFHALVAVVVVAIEPTLQD